MNRRVIKKDRLVVADAYLSANTAFNNTIINFDTVKIDTHGTITTGAGAWRFTSPILGYYLIQIFCASSASTDLDLYKNAANYRRLGLGTSNTQSGGSTVIRLEPGEYIDIRTTGNITLTGGTGTNQQTWISIVRIGR